MKRRGRTRLALAVIALVLIVAGVVAIEQVRNRREPGPAVRLDGPEEIVFDWSEQACEPDDFPDVPARAFRDADGQVQLISSHYVNRRMAGPSLDELTRDCTVVMASHHDPDPAMFDAWEWLHAVYTPDGETVYALVHDEYQGHRYPDQCPSGEYRRCWYNAVTLAVSRDGGASYEHAEPPNHLVASIPYPYEPDRGTIGIFNPSNIVYNASDDHYYTLVNVAGYQAQAEGICVMRTGDLADPTSWRAWDGEDFSVAFINPYTDSDFEPDKHVCQPVSRDQIHGMRHSLTFNTYLDAYLLIGVAPMPGSTSGDADWGIYFSLSDDLIHWSQRRLIMAAEVQWTFQCGDEHPIGYPSLLDPASRSRNFETSGQRPYLYFVRFNYDSTCEPTQDRDLIRVRIELSR